jgi:hypothetical protein
VAVDVLTESVDRFGVHQSRKDTARYRRRRLRRIGRPHWLGWLGKVVRCWRHHESRVFGAAMDLRGSCKCKKWSLMLSTAVPPGELRPRKCDCEYCASHPSTLISERSIVVELIGDRDNQTISQNGDRLASFHYCKTCRDLLAVDCEIEGRLRGAVNSDLLGLETLLGPTLAIQPRFLGASEKLERWSSLWGTLVWTHRE